MTTTAGQVSPDLGPDDRLLQRANAHWTAIKIAAMDPHTREDLATYLADLNNPELDQEDRRYIIEAIQELFTFGHCSPDGDLDEWMAFAEGDEGRHAHTTVKNDALRFFARYQEAKQRKGLSTQKEVAEICGLSPTTVNAFETQRVKPQMRTVQKLADGLGVPLRWLLGEDVGE
jgi:DNA-binding XRE family transcriptional regulator